MRLLNSIILFLFSFTSFLFSSPPPPPAGYDFYYEASPDGSVSSTETFNSSATEGSCQDYTSSNSAWGYNGNYGVPGMYYTTVTSSPYLIPYQGYFCDVKSVYYLCGAGSCPDPSKVIDPITKECVLPSAIGPDGDHDGDGELNKCDPQYSGFSSSDCDGDGYLNPDDTAEHGGLYEPDPSGGDTGDTTNYPTCDQNGALWYSDAVAYCQNQGKEIDTFNCTDDGGQSPSNINYTCKDTTTPDDGGGTTTPDDGGGTTTPDDGGGTTTPDDGGGTTTPDDGGGTTTPDDGGGTGTNRSFTVTYDGNSSAGVGIAETGAIEGLLTFIKDSFLNFVTYLKDLVPEASSEPDTTSSESSIADQSSFIDGFAEEFTTMIDDATSIKTEFDTLKSQLNGEDINKNINLSGGSCNMGFTLMGQTFHPLASLPGILSPYSSIFSIMVYVAIMFFNFRLAFNRGL